MNCFECAKASDAAPAVAICEHCGVGLCLDHLIEARGYRAGGTLLGCGHQMLRVRPSWHARGCRRVGPPPQRRLVTTTA